jgi:hypothetical protein
MALYPAASWIYVNTSGSLLLVMLMHSAVNQTLGMVPSAVPGADNPFGFHMSLVGGLTLALLWIAAAYFLVRMRRMSVKDPI